MQAFDRKFVYNMFMVYQPPFFKGQTGVVGHVLGGWTFAPVFTAGSGLPITLGTINGGGQAFGEGDSSNFFGYGNSENAIPITPFTQSGSAHYNVPGSTVNGVPIGTAGLGVNMFANPVAAWFNVRQPVLGYDTKDGGFGVLRGLPYWNVDLSLKKKFMITERVSTEFQVVFTNVFNHLNFNDPGPSGPPIPGGDYLDTSNSSTWGVLPGQTSTAPRTMEFGFRVSF